MRMFNIRRMRLRPRLSDARNKIERVDATGVRMAGGGGGEGAVFGGPVGGSPLSVSNKYISIWGKVRGIVYFGFEPFFVLLVS
jgi:hypothetical protein